jgi:DnaJ-class molecular chaperone
MKPSTYRKCFVCDGSGLVQCFTCSDCQGRGIIKEGSKVHQQQRILMAACNEARRRRKFYGKGIRANG